jgi:clan AA aspartic protease (TIGR02281 family)
MKKLLLFLAFMPVLLNAQTIIQMEDFEGVYKIPCVVNGAKMKFIFDTGASNVCISLPMAEYLYDNGFIEKDDIKGIGTSSVADGRIVNHVIINIKDFQIGEIHINNVETIVIEGQSAPLLMGLSAIKKLGDFEIKGNTLIINSNGGNTEENTIRELKNQIMTLRDELRYDDCLELYEQLYTIDRLSDEDKYDYANILYIRSNDEKALSVLKSIQNPQILVEKQIDYYRLFGEICMALNKYTDAINYFNLSNSRMNYEIKEIAYNTESIADCFYYKKIYDKAQKWYEITLDHYSKMLGVDRDILFRSAYNELKKGEKSYRNDTYDKLIFQWLECYYEQGGCNVNDYIYFVKKMAAAKNKTAQKHLNHLDSIISRYNLFK